MKDSPSYLSSVFFILAIGGALANSIAGLVIHFLPILVGCRGIVPNCWEAYYGSGPQSIRGYIIRIGMTVLITVLSVAVVESVRQQPKHRLTIISRLVVVVVIQLFLIFLTGWSVGVAFVPGTLLLIIAAILFWLMPQSTIPGSA